MVKLRASDRMGLHTFADENDEFSADVRRLAAVQEAT
jgi:hypothetical protein